jgi:hypothetical protein
VPIRFRCAYCNQLMGIARRKAGTVVRCPTCSGQVVVPNPDAANATGTEDSRRPEDPNAPLFERSDFDELFDVPAVKDRPPGTAPGAQPAAAPAGPWGTEAPRQPDVESLDLPGSVPLPVPGPGPGIVLSPGQVTFMAVGGILLLAVVFGAGVLVGKFLLGS